MRRYFQRSAAIFEVTLNQVWPSAAKAAARENVMKMTVSVFRQQYTLLTRSFSYVTSI
jgi:hypothetical protein